MSFASMVFLAKRSGEVIATGEIGAKSSETSYDIYVTGDPREVTVSHGNLATYITSHAGTEREAVAHCIATALISILTQSGKAGSRIAALAVYLRRAGIAGLPPDFAALCATVEQIEGVRFRELVERLAAAQTTGDELLAQVIATAMEIMNVKQTSESGDQERDAEM